MSKLEKLFGKVFGKDEIEFEEGHDSVLEVTVKGLTDEESDELNEIVMDVINKYLEEKDHTYNWKTDITED